MIEETLITVMIEKEIKHKKIAVDDLLTRKIIGTCYEVHRKLGPGFVEKTYLAALKIALKKNGLNYVSEKEFSVLFENEVVGKFRVDLLIEDKVIVELKSLEGSIPKIYELQVISYLRASKLKVGLLVNFGNSRCVLRRLVSSL